MKKKDKKLKKKARKSEQEPEVVDLKINKLEVVSKIDNLRFLAQKNRIEGNFEDAIFNAEQIIRLAILTDMPSYIKEQEEFINIMSKKVQEDYFISEIDKVCSSLNEMYDKLIGTSQISQAHEIIKSFKDRYKDVTYFHTIQSVKELLSKDQKIWVNFITGLDDES